MYANHESTSTELNARREMEEMRERGKEEVEAQKEIWKYAFGFTSMAVVRCAVELEIADTIENHGGSMTLQELSSTLQCNQTSLYRIMRYLVHFNFFKETPAATASQVDATTKGYTLTPLSKRLLKKGENSMADLILLESSPVMLAPWHCLSSRVLANGKPAFEGVHGDDVWKYASANPGHSRLIDNAMACNARLAVPAVIEGCPEVFDGVESLVDVGGGNGTALRLLVKAFPWIKGINFDLPHVVCAASNLDDGLRYVGGDFFKSIPKADAAYLMWVLHDWNDEECIQILKNCKEAIPKDKGKVIIVEAVVDDDDEQDKKDDDHLEFVRLTLDMVMMAHTNYGKERTSSQWDYVLGQAGFSRHTITPIRAVQSVIVAFP